MTWLIVIAALCAGVAAAGLAVLWLLGSFFPGMRVLPDALYRRKE